MRGLQIFVEHHGDGAQQQSAFRSCPESFITHFQQAVFLQLLYSTQFQGSYTKTDLRLTWTSANESVSVTGFIENIEDEAVLARTNTGSDDLVQGGYLYPQNYGLKLTYRY